MGDGADPGGRAILIAGPTASGKSAVAVALAERLGGVVVNADSMQVYRDLRILTARPSEAAEARVPHRLFGFVDAARAYSVGDWLRDVGTVLADARLARQVPVVVGGTGLYFKALTQGLSAIPPVLPAVREQLRAEALAQGSFGLHARLAARDPPMAARLRPTDTQRIVRALEVVESTGVSLAEFQKTRGAAQLPRDAVTAIFLAPDRAQLYEVIDRRFDTMIGSGALSEVAAIARRALDPTLPAMRALGLPELLGALDDPDSLSTAVATAKRATRHYAKRQFTFARHQLADWAWVDADRAQDAVLELWQRGRVNA